ncbi:class I SAM-dependent methyltransferase [Flexibacterium corallicola]|uniref:hypothetical protein n=1 Tax=Flexibacterium corallicola TaxID=3037259 RepID=UPI00286F22B5|nr:hypothetical protein [Pseudovibrio sp. M1P-2-3]
MVSTSSTISGMKGGGFYDENSAPQREAIVHLFPWLEDAVAGLCLPAADKTVRLADFGCSEGSNSCMQMSVALKALRERHSGPVAVIESDLPSNDFSSLLQSMATRRQAPFNDPHVFGEIVGGSMFNQLLAPNSVQLMTSYNTVGYFSRCPLERLEGHICVNGRNSSDGHAEVMPAEFQAGERQSRADFEVFLKVRAKEMMKGGKFLIQVFGRTERICTCEAFTDALNDALMDFVETGDVPRDVYERFYLPIFFKSLDDLLAPLQENNAPLAKLFKIEKAESFEVKVPFVERYKNDKDAVLYARQLRNFFQAFTEPLLHTALRETEKAGGLTKDIYAHAESLVRCAPENYQLRYMSVACLLTYMG